MSRIFYTLNDYVFNETSVLFRKETLEGKCFYEEIAQTDKSLLSAAKNAKFTLHEVQRDYRNWQYDIEISNPTISKFEFDEFLKTIIRFSTSIVNQIFSELNIEESISFKDWVYTDQSNSSKFSSHIWLASNNVFHYEDLFKFAKFVKDKLDSHNAIDLQIYTKNHCIRYWGFDKIVDGKFASRPKLLHKDCKQTITLNKTFMSLGNHNINFPEISAAKQELPSSPLKNARKAVEFILPLINDKHKNEYWRWVSIGRCIKGLLGENGQKLFDNWSKSGKGYDSAKNLALWNSWKADTDYWKLYRAADPSKRNEFLKIGKVKSEPSIFSIQKKINKMTYCDVLTRKLEDMGELVKADTTFLTAETMENDDETISDILSRKVSLIRSPCGTGKSKLVTKLLSASPEKSVIFIVHRITLGKDLLRKLESCGFRFYQDLEVEKGHYKPSEAHRIIVQMESLHHVPRMNYDWIILDESESVCTQLLSKNIEKPQVTFNFFSGLVTNAERIVCMDANLTALRTYEMLKICAKVTLKDVKLIVNDYKPFKDHKILLVNDQKSLFARMADDLTAGKKIVFSSNSKKIVKEAHVLAMTIVEAQKTLICTGEAPLNDNGRAILFENYSELKFFAFSPTIESGVSIEYEHFDRFYGYFKSNITNTQSCNQSMHRVRNLADKMYVICCNRGSGDYYPIDRETVKKHLAINCRELGSSSLDAFVEFDHEMLPHINLSLPIIEFVISERVYSNIDRNWFDFRFVSILAENGFRICCDLELEKEFKIEPIQSAVRQMDNEFLIEKISQETINKICEDGELDFHETKVKMICDIYGININSLVENIDKPEVIGLVKECAKNKRMRTYRRVISLIDDGNFMERLKLEETARTNKELLKNDDWYFKAKIGKRVIDVLGWDVLSNAEYKRRIDLLLAEFNGLKGQIHANFYSYKKYDDFTKLTQVGKGKFIGVLLSYYGVSYKASSKKSDASYKIDFIRINPSTVGLEVGKGFTQKVVRWETDTMDLELMDFCEVTKPKEVQPLEPRKKKVKEILFIGMNGKVSRVEKVEV